MSYIGWNKSYSVEVPDLDEHHMKLISIINKLYDNMRAGTARAHVMETLRELQLYASYHFSREESLMSDANYDSISEQLESHAAYLRRVNELSQTIHKEPEDLLLFLKNWWIDHITHSDMKYKGKLGAQRR